MSSPIHLEVQYHPNQSKIFFESDARFKVIAKGRRFGLTHGVANFFTESMVDGISPLLWVDTVHTNIDRYVERYWYPILQQIPHKHWKWRSQKKELTIFNTVCDFRSSDRPENIEGFGYKIIFINEAGIVLKKRYLWHNAILPMLMDFKGDAIIGGTPKGKKVKNETEKHEFYKLFKKAKADGQDWQHFQFSSYDNPFLDPDDVAEIEGEISPVLRPQEVHGKFIDNVESEIIKREWWKYYRELPMGRPIRAIQSWDTAFKKKEENDFSACLTVLEYPHGYFLTDLWKDHVEFPELKRQVVAEHAKHEPHQVIIEDKASGQSLIQEMKRETSLPIKEIPVDRDKVARVHSVTPIIEAGNCYLPESAPWVADFVESCADFPNGEHDDDVDALSQALSFLRGKGSGMPIVVTRKRTIEHEIVRGY